MVLITIVTGAYQPTYNWGASHCIYVLLYIIFKQVTLFKNGRGGMSHHLCLDVCPKYGTHAYPF